MSCTAGMWRRKTENRKLFSVGIKLSGCFCHVTLIHSSPANPHHSTTFHQMPKTGKKTRNTRWSFQLKTKLFNAQTIYWEHKGEYCRATALKGSQSSPSGGDKPLWIMTAAHRMCCTCCTGELCGLTNNSLNPLLDLPDRYTITSILQLTKLKHRKITVSRGIKPSQVAICFQSPHS